jgi:molybdenum cofactor cytidylyltransferase
MTVAVVLAAGRGTRMGGVAKALLRDGDRTYLERIVATLAAVECQETIVVVATPFGDEVAAAARALGAQVIVNPNPERGMASSIAIAFEELQVVFGRLSTVDAAWLWPVDHPYVDAATLRSLEAAIGTHEVARPRFDGRGGHPPLIAKRVWERFATCGDIEGGARTVIAALDVVDVVVQDPGVVRDIDTVDDARVRE